MYRRIVVPIDGSPAAALGLREATRLAGEQHAALRIVHVVNERPVISPGATGVNLGDVLLQLRADGEALLDAAEARARAGGVQAESVLVEEMGARAGACILKQARDWQADLIVCGTHGRRGMQRLLMGSDAEYIVRHTPIPVLLLRSPEAAAE